MKILTLTGRQAREAACTAIHAVPEGWVVRISEPTRTLEANALMWVLLTAFAEQLSWPVNGKMVKLEPEEWKDVLTAGYESATVRLAQGLDGGVVMLGRRTRKYGKNKMNEFIEFMMSVGVERGVVFNEMEMA
jgi:hypothetical protein